MMVHYDSTSGQIKAYLENLIMKNRFIPNFKLPSENKLAALFHSSRSPAKRALAELKEEGLIHVVHGKGAFVVSGKEPGEASICMIMPHIDTPFSWEIVKGARDFCSQKGIQLFVTFSNNNALTEEKAINNFLNNAFSGLLLYPVIDAVYHDALLKLALSKESVTIIAQYLHKMKFGNVYCDSYDQIYQAMEFLIQKGHTRIGYIAESANYNNLPYQERLIAYQNCMKEKIPGQETFYLGVYIPPENCGTPGGSIIENDRMIEDFFAKNPGITAVITASVLAEKVISTLYKQSGMTYSTAVIIDEPENVNVFAGKDVYVLDQNPYQIGEKAAERLYDQIFNDKSIDDIVLKATIVPVADMLRKSFLNGRVRPLASDDISVYAK